MTNANQYFSKKVLTLTLRHSVYFCCEVMKLKMLIKEFADFTGVSVRTLHYYDEIGLLLPAVVDRYTGYRFYDENSLLRMQEILFYRELDFSLNHKSSTRGLYNSSILPPRQILIFLTVRPIGIYQ